MSPTWPRESHRTKPSCPRPLGRHQALEIQEGGCRGYTLSSRKHLLRPLTSHRELTPTTKKTTGIVTRSQETWPPQTSQKVVPPTKDQPRTWDPSIITPIRRPELLPSRSRFVFISMPIQGHRFVQGNANTLHKASHAVICWSSPLTLTPRAPFATQDCGPSELPYNIRKWR